MIIPIIAVFAFCFILERVIPGWPRPKVRTWPVRVLLINAVQLGIVLLAGLTWERWLSSTSVFHLSEYLSPAVGGLIAYFIATFVFYWWHRWRHEHDFLWRGFHQIHHSPQRLEVITSFYKHPGEMIVNSIIGSLLVYTFLGLSLEAGVIYTLCTALGEFFYHTNIKTPRWIGFFFQRPGCIESTINTTATRTTTAISPGGTCYSAPMKTQRSGFTPADLTLRRKSSCYRCLRTKMYTMRLDAPLLYNHDCRANPYMVLTSCAHFSQ